MYPAKNYKLFTLKYYNSSASQMFVFLPSAPLSTQIQDKISASTNRMRKILCCVTESSCHLCWNGLWSSLVQTATQSRPSCEIISGRSWCYLCLSWTPPRSEMVWPLWATSAPHQLSSWGKRFSSYWVWTCSNFHMLSPAKQCCTESGFSTGIGQLMLTSPFGLIKFCAHSPQGKSSL